VHHNYILIFLKESVVLKVRKWRELVQEALCQEYQRNWGGSQMGTVRLHIGSIGSRKGWGQRPESSGALSSLSSVHCHLQPMALTLEQLGL
jgi:hypothetical protein